MEDDYLAHVVTCENGSASFEALKAQAVAARSYAYYKIVKGGQIADGQSDQVYTCSRKPSSEHYAAVNATSGEVLMYQSEVIAAFYVSGAIPSSASCVATSTDSDPLGTENYVTYNEGKSGTDLTQTTLGWVNAGNIYNRGCMSQNGSHCLAQNGYLYRDILRFYYGADIQIEKAIGTCVITPDAAIPDAQPVDSGVPVDTAVFPDVTVQPDVALEDSVASADTAGIITIQGGCAFAGKSSNAFSEFVLVALIAMGLALHRRSR